MRAGSIWETNSGYNMAIELRQQLKLTQQLIMTPQLQMAIKLLQLSRLELMDKIGQELEENPALEEVQEVALQGAAAGKDRNRWLKSLRRKRKSPSRKKFPMRSTGATISMNTTPREGKFRIGKQRFAEIRSLYLQKESLRSIFCGSFS